MMSGARRCHRSAITLRSGLRILIRLRAFEAVVNAVVMLIMITSGWGIYDDNVIIRGFHFSSFWRLGDWAVWSLNWHFAGMWFLVRPAPYHLFAAGNPNPRFHPTAAGGT